MLVSTTFKSSGLLPRNPDQGLPHRKEAGNPNNLSEVQGLLV
jgi:hypothetical protein